MPHMMKPDRFSRFEDQIQRLVEGGFARLFAGYLHPREVAVQLIRAMEDHAQQGTHGQAIAPDVYIVRLNPQDHRVVLESEMDFVAALADELVEVARSLGLTLDRVPEVRLLADQDVSPHEVSVSAQHSASRRETTQAMPLAEMPAAGTDSAPRAMLIISDSQQIPLDQPIINLGRQRNNDIIIDDIRASRHHAQIRLRFGRFVLFDLGSTGGTTVNGYAVQEQALQSGDVIGLAGNTLIYVEEIPPDEATPDEPPADTQSYPPVEA